MLRPFLPLLYGILICKGFLILAGTVQAWGK